MDTQSTVKAFGGTQGVYTHQSDSTGTPMTFSVFVPEGDGPFPVLWYLSGLTCTHANVTENAEAAYDFGLGAGFYVNATQAPFDEHYQMRSYIEDELPNLIAEQFPADMSRQAITGHSMGGHGALTIGLRNSDQFKSISAFSPIVSPINCPWGEKALDGYIGDDKAAWRDYDACALIEDGARADHILVEQGLADGFLAEQLKTDLLKNVCETVNQPVTIRMQEGYDHSYYFISTFMVEHVAWHAERLKA